MATHYTATSGTYNHWKYGRTGTWKNVWYQMSITVDVAADGTCTYSIKSTNNAGDYTSWPRCQVSVWIEIGGETVVAKKMYKNDGFPRYLDSTQSGTLANKITGGTVSIKSRILPASDWSAHDGGKGEDDWWGEALNESTLTRNYWEDSTAPTCSISQKTAGSNTITFSGNLGTAKHGNGMTSATLYYWMNGATEWASEALTATSGAAYSKTKTCDRDGYIWAYVSCVYAHQTKSSSSEYNVYCYYYGTGTTPGAPSISQTAGDNTITIKGDRGNSPARNTVKSSTLYYKFAGASSYTSVALSTSSTTYTKTFEMDSGNDKKKLLAYVSTEYQYGGKKTGSETTSTNNCLYYDDVKPPNITITDHGNNTFTISATAGASGSNNTAKGLVSGSLKWGYAASDRNMEYSAGGEHPFTLETSGTGETRTVYAEATTDATYIQDIKGTANKAIKQYLAPTTPGTPTLDEATSLKNGRLTIKKNWKYTWTASSKQGKNGVSGYRIRIQKKPKGGSSFSAITGLICSNNVISKGTGTNTVVHSTNTTRSITFDPGPNGLGFKPGDQVKIEVWGYSIDGSTAKNKKYSAVAATPDPQRTVQNAGVVKIKVNNTWKEGVVWIKVNNTWKEASAIFAKVGSSWKEST